MWMLDTNTVSYFFRGVVSVRDRLLATAPGELAVSTVVVYELKTGLWRLADEHARQVRLAALEIFLAPLTLIAFDTAEADQAAQIAALLATRGTPIGPHDVMIAACARAHNATLVTHNTTEFARVPELELEDWY